MDWLKKKKGGAFYFWAGFLTVVLVSVIGFAIIKVWPFGDGTVLVIDSLHQYLPFYTDYHNKLVSGDTLFYSFSAGLGYNFWATFAYYMASPVNLLMVFVPAANVADFMDLMILLKMGLCAGTFSWYLHRRDPDRPVMPVAFGAMFALGNFIIGYYFNLMWLDSIAMTPLIMYGIERLVRGKGGRIYGLSLFAALWCNYYIGFMLCIFSCLYLAVSFIEYRETTGRSFGKGCLTFAVYSLLAGGMASVVLLPAYRALASSESVLTNSFPKNVKFYTDFVQMMIAHFAAQNPINISDTQVGLNAYCGASILIFAILYILDGRIALRKRICRAALAGLFLLSFSMNILNYIWHGFHQQNGLPNRFAFLYVIILLVMAYDTAGHLEYMKLWKILCAGLIPLAFSLAVMAAGAIDPEAPGSLSLSDIETYGNWNWVTPVLLVIYLCILLAIFLRRMPKKRICVFLGGMLLLEASLHGIRGFIYNENVTRSIYLADQASYKKLVGAQNDTDFFRSEIDSQRMRNVTMYAGGRSMVMFNSTMLASVTDLCDHLGIEARTNKNGYNGVTRLMNDVFGIRYVLSSKGKGDTLYQFRKVTADDNLTLYKNDNALSLGFMVNDEIREWDSSDGDPIDVQNQFVRLATGIDGLYILDRTIEAEDKESYGIKVPDDKQVYIWLEDRISSVKLTTPEYDKTYTTYTDHLYVVNALGDENIANIETDLKDSQSTVKVCVYTCPNAQYQQVRDALAQNQLENIEIRGSRVKGTVEAERSGILLMTLPYEKSWKVLVDSNETQAVEVGQALMGIPLEAGSHTIELKYVPAGFFTGLWLSILCALLFLAAFLWEWRRMAAGETVSEAEESEREFEDWLKEKEEAAKRLPGEADSGTEDAAEGKEDKRKDEGTVTDSSDRKEDPGTRSERDDHAAEETETAGKASKSRPDDSVKKDTETDEEKEEDLDLDEDLPDDEVPAGRILTFREVPGRKSKKAGELQVLTQTTSKRGRLNSGEKTAAQYEEELKEIVGPDRLLVREPMSRHTTFRVGGAADYYAVPESGKELFDVIRYCDENHLPWYLIGNGSNLLVSDAGFRGVIIQLFRNWNDIWTEGTSIHAQAGALLSVIAKEAAAHSLTGLEFASGIPGTLGGALTMNAGAYGGEMKDVVRSVRILTREGKVRTVYAEDMGFGYRTSNVEKEGWIVLSAEMVLKEGDQEKIRGTMAQLQQQRQSKQPLDVPSAGSTFKRPEGYFAGKLIMDAGLKGYRVGGACVSPKHCGFIVNDQGATAEEIRTLMSQVQEKVLKEFGVKLEPEVKMLGEWE